MFKVSKVPRSTVIVESKIDTESDKTAELVLFVNESIFKY